MDKCRAMLREVQDELGRLLGMPERGQQLDVSAEEIPNRLIQIVGKAAIMQKNGRLYATRFQTSGNAWPTSRST